jgi:hypothetical protein
MSLQCSFSTEPSHGGTIAQSPERKLNRPAGNVTREILERERRPRAQCGLADAFHFQSHSLPAGYDERLHSEGRFGKLDVWLVDPYDVFLSKPFSARTEDRDDLRALVPRLSKDEIIARYLGSTKSLQAEEPATWSLAR